MSDKADEYPTRPYHEFEHECDNKDGLVLLDASSRDRPWLKALQTFETRGCVLPTDFEAPFYIETTGGRKDLVVFYNRDSNTLDLEKLSETRKEICSQDHSAIGRIAWAEDYLMNYGMHHQPKLHIFGGVGVERIHPARGLIQENVLLSQLINDHEPSSKSARS